LDKIFLQWFREFKKNQSWKMPTHVWYWDGFSHVDPVKESRSETLDMQNGTRTIVDVCAEHGRDWKVQIENKLQAEKFERERRQALGLPQIEDKPEQISTGTGGDE